MKIISAIIIGVTEKKMITISISPFRKSYLIDLPARYFIDKSNTNKSLLVSKRKIKLTAQHLVELYIPHLIMHFLVRRILQGNEVYLLKNSRWKTEKAVFL